MLKSLAYLLTFCLILAGCSPSTDSKKTSAWAQQNGKLKVLSTVAMIDDLVSQIGGEHIDTQVLVKGDLNPHAYQLVKGDDEKLAIANIIFYNGLGLEHGPSLQHYLHSNDKSVSLGDSIAKAEPNAILYINGTADPHIWMDVSMWAKTIPYIVKVLVEKDPTHAETYKKNGEKLQQKLMETHQQIVDLVHTVPSEKRFLVTSHDAFNYFTRSYLATPEETSMADWQKRFAAPEGLAPESQLSTNDIKIIIDHLRQYNICVLFPESNVNRDSIRKIVDAGRQEGLTLRISEIPLYADAMGKPGSDGDTYIKMLLHNAKTISGHIMECD